MRFLGPVLLLALLALYGAAPNSTPVLNTLFRFTGRATGAYPEAPVIFGVNGTLYGATTQGGSAGSGTAFQLTPPAAPGKPWTAAALYSFGALPGAPATPNGLIFDSLGSLYGTSINGGGAGLGAVFQLSPPSGGSGPWTETTLYSFTGSSDGAAPAGNLVFGATGALYGVTSGGGAPSQGTVFALTPSGGGWTESVLHTFGQSGDGAAPHAGLVIDKNGVLYGTTSAGGSANQGTVFALTPPAVSGGAWTETVLYNFTGGSDGGNPGAPLLFGKRGGLYGTTYAGGSAGLGTVFRVSPPVSGSTWTESVLYSFSGGRDGAHPQSSLIFNRLGALYGTTGGGGIDDLGTVFKLTPPTPGGSWTETVLYQFQFSDGSLPVAGLALNANGALFGTTENGGTPEKGTVFRLVP